ncbi:MAG: hypothetical protein CVU43_14695 [Chloroflexi bacterium HGW-Chloroflexi-5]|nr:MAG: hypothetical protein CVU43_14695 [Chloroflexi bacterium HGW-Chloroflexi-5]
MTRSPFLTALFNPLNILMLLGAILAGLISAWWLFPAGLVLWLIMVIVVARDPGLQISFTRQSRQPLAMRFQARFNRIDRARMTIFNLSGQSSQSFKLLIDPIEEKLDDLVEQVYQISLRMSALDNAYAIQKISNNFDNEISNLEKQILTTTDPGVKAEYLKALQSLIASKENSTNLAQILDRFQAQLTSTVNVVDSVVTGVASLKGLNEKQIKGRIEPLIEIIENDCKKIHQFDVDVQKIALN